MPKENKTIYVILGLLSHESLSGYDIKKRIDSQISYFWDAGYGQIYPTLQKLAQDGLVSMQVENGESRLDRKIYAITALGRQTLFHWLQLPVTEENIKYEILLKLFFGSEISASENIHLIQEFKARQLQNLETLNQFAANLRTVLADDQAHVYYFLTVLFGQYIHNAYLAWADEAVQILNHQFESETIRKAVAHESKKAAD